MSLEYYRYGNYHTVIRLVRVAPQDNTQNDDNMELGALPSASPSQTHTDSAQMELEILPPHRQNIHTQEATPLTASQIMQLCR